MKQIKTTYQGNQILLPLFKPCTDKDIKNLKKRERKPYTKKEIFNWGTDFDPSVFEKLSGYKNWKQIQK